MTLVRSDSSLELCVSPLCCVTTGMNEGPHSCSKALPKVDSTINLFQPPPIFISMPFRNTFVIEHASRPPQRSLAEDLQLRCHNHRPIHTQSLAPNIPEPPTSLKVLPCKRS